MRRQPSTIEVVLAVVHGAWSLFLAGVAFRLAGFVSDGAQASPRDDRTGDAIVLLFSRAIACSLFAYALGIAVVAFLLARGKPTGIRLARVHVALLTVLVGALLLRGGLVAAAFAGLVAIALAWHGWNPPPKQPATRRTEPERASEAAEATSPAPSQASQPVTYRSTPVGHRPESPRALPSFHRRVWSPPKYASSPPPRSLHATLRTAGRIFGALVLLLVTIVVSRAFSG